MTPHAPLPVPSRTRWPLAAALVVLLAGALLLVLAFGLRGGGRSAAAATPPPAPAVQVIVPTAAAVPEAAPTAQAQAPQDVEDAAAERRFVRNDGAHVPADWVAGFYAIYEVAQRTFGVNWLLIASVHKQETAFSTHPTTYRGLNFANCCAGPMQFNVTNGPLTTWQRYGNAYKKAADARPAHYPHETAEHPSVYDDFDAIMAAAALLRDNGAGLQLDAGAWTAAYDYYGHDLSGVDYADQVLARALGWGRTRFCINCELDSTVLGAVAAAWGAPVRARQSPAA